MVITLTPAKIVLLASLLPESKCAVISEISNASKMERNGAVKMENTDALF